MSQRTGFGSSSIQIEQSDAAIGRSALHKASLRLIPLMALGYGAAYIDRVNISFAALQMNRDLHLSSAAYGLGAGLFFLSYAAFEVPSNLLLYRIGARRWLSRIMLTWGVIAMAMLFVKTPMEFYGMRALLGAAEAGFFPGVIFYLMQWFPPEMRARTITRFYISLPLSSVVMGGVAGALLNLQGFLGLAGWQWLFLVEGLPAIALAAAFFFLLPDGPAKARWLTPRERDWIIGQVMRASETASHRGESIWPALRDPRVGLLGAFMFCFSASGYAFMLFGPAIIQETSHFDATQIGYILALSNLLGAAAMLLNGMHSDRSGERYWHVIVPCFLMAGSLVLCGTSSAPYVVVPGFAALILANSAMQGPLWSLPATFLQGRPAATGIAAINTISIFGAFLGPYWMGVARDITGTFERGLLTMAIPMLIATAIMFYLRHLTLEVRQVPVEA
ncbi:MAG TPA: MFS transporter [Terracidiphilus sp.]|jgi:ACS family tartrate transporter-like MFS transporter|nr:MFS transporter [Terracidiphilus sp.]